MAIARTLLVAGETATVEGFSDLYDALKTLSRATERNVLKRALTKAGKPILDAAKANAPVKTGKLRDAIVLSVGVDDPGFRARAAAAFAATGSAVGVKRTVGGGQVLAQVHVGGAQVPYASFIELGRVRAPAHPFLRPAFDEKQREALDLIRQEITIELVKATARGARKLAKALG